MATQFRRLKTSSVNSLEALERRQLLAAHIANSPTVYATIQAAVDAAAPGATITVDAGTYPELVSIFKPLTIKGAQAGKDARDGSRGSNESIVRGADFGGGNRSSAFYIAADNVTIDGFTARDDTSSGVYGAGITIAPLVSGTHIINDIITSNVSGVYLANSSATNQTLIQHDLITFNNNPGNNNGRGIYSDGGVSGGNLTNVLIDANTFIGNVGDGTSGNPEAAIGLEAQTAGKQSNITISNNVMNANGKGVLAYNITGLTIKNNLITGSTDSASAALRFEGNAGNVVIQSNTVAFGLGAAVRLSNRFTAANFNITMANNNFVSNAGGGVFIDPGGYIGTLSARGNYWGSSFGPSGAGAGFGDAVTGNGTTVDFSNWLTSPTTTAPSLGLGARANGRMILADLTAYRATLSAGSVRNALDGVIAEYTSSLSASLWLNDSTAKQPNTVLAMQLDAAVKLAGLAIFHSVPASPAGGLIQRMLDADLQIIRSTYGGLVATLLAIPFNAVANSISQLH